jgi:hypothetical protein
MAAWPPSAPKKIFDGTGTITPLQAKILFRGRQAAAGGRGGRPPIAARLSRGGR